jgi:Lhr-like helicase
MTYKIVIERTQDVIRKVGREWEKVGQVEKKREVSFYDGQSDQPKTYLSDEYGYTPEVEKTVSETVKLYEQSVEELDLAAVILAVNKLKASHAGRE